MNFPTTEREYERLNFIAQEEGLKAAVEFAKRTMGLYRHTTLHGFRNSGRVSVLFRKPLITSYQSLKRFYFLYKSVL